ncbi:2-hydroxyacid dehydrogenase [Paenibacillus senegalensis]|uniref:2-hydroxyacid dehydrogenase n=1 Tax=Paenibacillus senegalensis TaxID=1465766 RepID=UPI000289EA8D
MKPRIFVTKPVPAKVEEFLSAYCDCVIWKENAPLTREQLLERVKDVEGLIVTSSSPRIDQELLDAAPRLKAVCSMSVGYDNIDVQALRQRGVVATHTPDVLNDTVADLVMTLMLSSARRAGELERYIREGKWQKKELDGRYFGVDVHHATLGIIGMGRIGEAVARRAQFGFDMKVQYYNRRPRTLDKRLEAAYVSLDELLETSDFIVVLTPLTPETRHLIGDKEFAKMKKQPILINVSRGPTVDEEALLRALEQKQIRGAALDVFYKEPIPGDHPLLQYENVTALPHIGSATHATRFKMAMLAAENMANLISGKPPLTEIR